MAEPIPETAAEWKEHLHSLPEGSEERKAALAKYRSASSRENAAKLNKKPPKPKPEPVSTDPPPKPGAGYWRELVIWAIRRMHDPVPPAGAEGESLAMWKRANSSPNEFMDRYLPNLIKGEKVEGEAEEDVGAGVAIQLCEEWLRGYQREEAVRP